jgi:ubiquinone/menaquinone biosynthesis C-methylase UbiE
VKRRTGVLELLDGELDRGLLRGNLDDLERVNRWLGGAVLSRRAVVRLLAGRVSRDRPVRLLDVGTGAADIPVTLIGWFADRGVGLHATACDTRREIVEEARRRTSGVERVTVELIGEGALPFDDAAFDVAHISMVVHHLEERPAVDMFRELARLSRLGVVVNDLDRTEAAWLGALALARITTRNRYTRTDGPMSVQRAWRAPEVERMAAEAGLRRTATFRHPLGYRYAIAFEHDRDR